VFRQHHAGKRTRLRGGWGEHNKNWRAHELREGNERELSDPAILRIGTAGRRVKNKHDLRETYTCFEFLRVTSWIVWVFAYFFQQLAGN